MVTYSCSWLVSTSSKSYGGTFLGFKPYIGMSILAYESSLKWWALVCSGHSLSDDSKHLLLKVEPPELSRTALLSLSEPELSSSELLVRHSILGLMSLWLEIIAEFSLSHWSSAELPVFLVDEPLWAKDLAVPSVEGREQSPKAYSREGQGSTASTSRTCVCSLEYLTLLRSISFEIQEYKFKY